MLCGTQEYQVGMNEWKNNKEKLRLIKINVPLKWFQEGLRFADVWSENAALYKKLMKISNP